MKKYKEFTITAEPFNAEILSSILWELEITGINEEVNCLKVFADESTNLNPDIIGSFLKKLQNERLLFSFAVEENIVEEKNWNEEWEKSINVIEVSDKIIIKPTFRDYEAKPGQVIISIDPKMSFGTGEHSTTKLMLQFVEKYVKKGMKVLDVGSGTGILAIAAIKLGAVSAIAVDNDEWCLGNGKENCELNKVADKIDVRLGVVQDIPDKDYDLILANIQKNVLIEISTELVNRMAGRGMLILSGLLDSDVNDIKEEYERLELNMIDKQQMGEWIAVVFGKKAHKS
jgi:ribosomal protein L11 methyltransferase